MLRELAPAESALVGELIDEPSEEQSDRFYAAARAHGFAFALEAKPPAPEAEDDVPQNLSLLDVAEAAEKPSRFAVGVCAEPATALQLQLNVELRALLEDASRCQADPRLQDARCIC